jgi:acyl-CoA hydrolase
MPAISNWREKITTPLTALKKIKPGMNIFIGTGAAEPRTLVKQLMTSKAGNLQDLTLIQMVSLGDVISLEATKHPKIQAQDRVHRLGGFAKPSKEGRVDLIPCTCQECPMHDHLRADCGGCRLHPGNPA